MNNVERSEIPTSKALSGKPKSEYYYLKEKYKEKLQSFESYLQKLGNGKDTIRHKLNYMAYFFNWMESEHLHPNEITYNDLLNFIDYCKLEGKSKKHINRKLSSIRGFYENLKESNLNIINPAVNLYLKGSIQKIPSDIIEYGELEELYQSFETANNRDKRNKVILGLLIYQGLTSGELNELKVENLKLKQGKIFIPGNQKRNNRILELKSFQVLELYEYVNEIKPEIIKEVRKPKPARKPKQINKRKLKEQLFISINGSENIKNSLFHLFRKIRKTKPEILHTKQIRASVIVYWLKQFNLRQVQYMAGHKYVSSTERYQMNHLEGLKNSLEKFHPLNGVYTKNN